MKPSRRHFFGTGLGLLALPVLSGCAGFGVPHSLTITQGEIDRRILQEFPQQRRLLEIFDVTLLAPSLALQPERDRVAATVELQVHDRLLDGRWQGRIQFDAGLRWVSQDQTLRLDQVQVRDLAWRDGDGAGRDGAERLAAVVAERMLEGRRLYRLPAEAAARLQRWGVMPGRVDVTERGIEVTLVPLPAAPPAAAS